MKVVIYNKYFKKMSNSTKYTLMKNVRAWALFRKMCHV
jgi:hypothetical protein